MKPRKITATDTETIDVQPLIQTETMMAKFSGLTKNIAIYKEYSNTLAIKEDKDLLIAENKSKEINEIGKAIDNIHKDLKAPYLATCRTLDEYKKTVAEPIDKIKKAINDAIANYKTVQAAMARAELQKKGEQLRKIQEEKTEEINKIERIQKQLVARLYGGIWFNKDGIRSQSSGCLKPEDCDALVQFITDKYPKSSAYIHMSDESHLMKRDILKLIAKHKVNLIGLSSENIQLRQKALEDIANAKIQAGIKSEQAIEKLNVSAEKESKKELSREEKNVKTAEKGVRKILKFVVIDSTKVPLSYMMVDESAIKEYMSENIETIKKRLFSKDDVNDIPGVKFYIEDVYATS